MPTDGDRAPSQERSEALYNWVMAGVYVFAIAANVWIAYKQQDTLAPWKSEVAKRERAMKLAQLRADVDRVRRDALAWCRSKLDAHVMHRAARDAMTEPEPAGDGDS